MSAWRALKRSIEYRHRALLQAQELADLVIKIVYFNLFVVMKYFESNSWRWVIRTLVCLLSRRPFSAHLRQLLSEVMNVCDESFFKIFTFGQQYGQLKKLPFWVRLMELSAAISLIKLRANSTAAKSSPTCKFGAKSWKGWGSLFFLSRWIW